MNYPKKCLKYGHDHSGNRTGYGWTAHNEQCKRFFFWPPFKECPHMQTFEEAVLEANGGKWPEPPPPPPPMPPQEIHVYHHEVKS